MKGKIQFITAMFIFSTIGLVSTFAPMSGIGISFVRALLGLLFFLIYKLIRREKTDFSLIRKEKWMLLLTGLFMSISWVSLFSAFKEMGISKSTIIYYLGPVVVLGYGMIFGHEKGYIKKSILIILAVIGLILVVGINDGSTTSVKGIIYAVISAVSYAAFMITSNKNKTSSIDKNIIYFSVCLIITTPLFFIFKCYDITYDLVSISSLLCLGFIHTGLSYFLYISGMDKMSSSEISLLCYIDPVGAYILSIIILREGTTITSLIGAILVLSSLIVYEISENVTVIPFIRKNKIAKKNI